MQMKKGLIMIGECMLLIIALLVIKIILGKCIPETEGSNVLNFILYCLSGMGSVLIYRLNTEKSKE